MSTERYDIVVVGASVAGMAFVLALREAGFRIAVIDRQVSFDEKILTWGHDLEPNALNALEAIGMLDTIEKAGARHGYWYAEREGGGALSKWDYTELEHSKAYAVCIRAHILRQALRDAAARVPGVEMMIPAELTALRREGGQMRVSIKRNGQPLELSAPLVIGADGPGSHVRAAAGIGVATRRYSLSWADTIMGRPEDEVTEGYIYFGRGMYLGIVPTRARELVAFQLTPAKNREEYAASFGSLEGFRRRYAEIAPILKSCVGTLESWDQTTVTPGIRVRADRWVADGVALAGDAAVTVNPITSQGVCLALEQGVSLATIAKRCFARSNFSAASLAPYEVWRRGQAETVQELGDLCLWGFGTSNPVLSYLKERMLQRLSNDPAMRKYVLATFCGLHWLTPAPLGIADGLAGAGIWKRAAWKYALVAPQAG